MKWLWLIWGCLAIGMIAIALHQELDAIRRRQGGANGLVWLAAMIVSALGSVVVSAFTWWIAGGQQAMYVAAAAAASLAVIGFYSVRRFKCEIRKASVNSRFSAS